MLAKYPTRRHLDAVRDRLRKTCRTTQRNGFQLEPGTEPGSGREPHVRLYMLLKALLIVLAWCDAPQDLIDELQSFFRKATRILLPAVNNSTTHEGKVCRVIDMAMSILSHRALLAVLSGIKVSKLFGASRIF